MKSLFPEWFNELSHTADIGIEVYSSTLPGLFERCAWGMFFELTEIDSISPTHPFEIQVYSSDRESLLVRWLSELNYLHTVEHLLFSRFEIKEWNEYELKADCWGEKNDPSRHSVWLEIKAITYHLLKIEYHPEGSEDCRWYGRVLFDV